jgi:hypothetical protein
VPELDYALLCDYVRTEGGVAHAIAAGLDTIIAPSVPTGQNVGLLLRLTFTRNECGRPHRLEVIFQDIDGERLAGIQAVITPEWAEGLPVGWPTGLLWGVNVGLPLPRYGVYALELLLNDANVDTLNLRVVPLDEPSG